MRITTAVSILLFSVARLLGAQGVLIAPHALYLEHRTRGGSLTLYNPGNDPVEVSLGFIFGYPVTDSAGGFDLKTVEIPDSTLPSAAQWIQAFPRRVSLMPLERQTVRLLAKPPANLRDGEYWARLVVSAKGGSVPVSGVSDSTGIRVGLTLEVRTILPVLYRKGKLVTGVAVSRLHANRLSDSLRVQVHLVREGQAAFIGSLRGTLVDSTGRTLASSQVPTAVYYEMDPSLLLPLAGVGPGRYRVRLDVTSEREDVPADHILPIIPIRDSTEVELR